MEKEEKRGRPGFISDVRVWEDMDEGDRGKWEEVEGSEWAQALILLIVIGFQ